MLRPRALVALVLLAPLAAAQIPPGYYDSVDTSNAAALRATLHAVIDDHVRYPYTSSGTDTWDILELKQQDPSNGSRIVDVYKNESYAKQGGGNSDYDREHSWPKSYGFPNDSSTNYPYTDCHVLFLADSVYNSSRGNKPFRNASASDTERNTVLTNGVGGGTGVFPGNSNWTFGVQETGGWQTWGQRKGDLARALLYMDVRYEGGTHGTTGAAEPDLILTDNEALIGASNTGNNESVAYMGLLSVLLQWHAEDPPDDFERNGNDVVYSFQGNRNPFIDHPEWVDCLFASQCSFGGLIGPLCFGDGTGVACPCGNLGNGQGGCGNSTYFEGAGLSPTGSASVAAADLVLHVFSSTPNQPGLFFQGTSAVNGGNGLPFGDGLRCVGGSVLRLQVVFADVFGDLQSSANLVTAGAVAPGDTRYYQWWYRDPGASPCGTGFNLSQAWQVVWEL
ncbi:MAG: endonuclease [Planctomycetes bacterium]|nr:endonuclease [Planctomycetota bacterium]